MPDFNLFLFKTQLWVLTRAGLIDGGPWLHMEPVIIVSKGNAKELGDALRWLAREPVVHLPESALADAFGTQSIYSRALGLKTHAAFARKSRFFRASVKGDRLSIEEWRRRSSVAFEGPPLWMHRESVQQMEKLARVLIAHTSKA